MKPIRALCLASSIYEMRAVMVRLSRDAMSPLILRILLIEVTACSIVSASDYTDGHSANEQAIVKEFEKRGGEVIFDWTGEFDLQGSIALGAEMEGALDRNGNRYLHREVKEDGQLNVLYSVGGEIHAGVYVRFPLFYRPSADKGLLDALPTLKGLEALDLRHTYVTDKDLCIVSDLRGLKVLLLDGTLVTDGGLSHLKRLTRLEQLHLDWVTGISSEGLKNVSGLPVLRYIHAVNTSITDDDMQTLKKSFPNTVIDISTPGSVPMYPKVRLYSSDDEQQDVIACRDSSWRRARPTTQFDHVKRWRKCLGLARNVRGCASAANVNNCPGPSHPHNRDNEDVALVHPSPNSPPQ